MSAEFTMTAIKALKRKSKDELVQAIMEMCNYAEKQKAANIILTNAMEQLKQIRAKELEAAASVGETSDEQK